MQAEINRKELKAKAKELAFSNLWKLWKPFLVIFGIIFAIGFLVGLLGIEKGSLLYSLITIAMSLVGSVFMVAEISYFIHFVRGEERGIIDLIKSKMKLIFSIAIASAVISLCTFGLTLLLIVPGIIYALKVVLVPYIFADDETENLAWGTIIKRSKTLMEGNKMDFFVFGLSFFGWILLATTIIGAIWAVPYIQVAQVMYYEELKTKKAELLKEEA